MQYGVAGSAAFLECQPRSPQATVKWLFQRDPSDRRREVSSYVPQGQILHCGCGSSCLQWEPVLGKQSLAASLGQPSLCEPLLSAHPYTEITEVK